MPSLCPLWINGTCVLLRGVHRKRDWESCRSRCPPRAGRGKPGSCLPCAELGDTSRDRSVKLRGKWWSHCPSPAGEEPLMSQLSGRCPWRWGFLSCSCFWQNPARRWHLLFSSGLLVPEGDFCFPSVVSGGRVMAAEGGILLQVQCLCSFRLISLGRMCQQSPPAACCAAAAGWGVMLTLLWRIRCAPAQNARGFAAGSSPPCWGEFHSAQLLEPYPVPLHNLKLCAGTGRLWVELQVKWARRSWICFFWLLLG